MSTPRASSQSLRAISAVPTFTRHGGRSPCPHLAVRCSSMPRCSSICSAAVSEARACEALCCAKACRPALQRVARVLELQLLPTVQGAIDLGGHAAQHRDGPSGGIDGLQMLDRPRWCVASTDRAGPAACRWAASRSTRSARGSTRSKAADNGASPHTGTRRRAAGRRPAGGCETLASVPPLRPSASLPEHHPAGSSRVLARARRRPSQALVCCGGISDSFPTPGQRRSMFETDPNRNFTNPKALP